MWAAIIVFELGFVAAEVVMFFLIVKPIIDSRNKLRDELRHDLTIEHQLWPYSMATHKSTLKDVVAALLDYHHLAVHTKFGRPAEPESIYVVSTRPTVEEDVAIAKPQPSRGKRK